MSLRHIRQLFILLALGLTGCGYRWVRSPNYFLGPCEISPITNLTVDLRAGGLARRALGRYVLDTLGATRRIHLTILPTSTTIRGVDADDLGAISKVEAMVQMKVSSNSEASWTGKPRRVIRYFSRGRTSLQSRMARQDAFRIALEAAIMDAVSSYHAHMTGKKERFGS